MKKVSLQRAVGVAPLARAVGMHRYTGSWTGGGNPDGVHTQPGFLKAVCPAAQNGAMMAGSAALPACLRPCVRMNCD